MIRISTVIQAWNTSANTLGSLICGAKVKYLAKKYNTDAFKNSRLQDFLDDWAYQANIRQSLTTPNIENLFRQNEDYEKIVSEVLNTEINAKYTYPGKDYLR